MAGAISPVSAKIRLIVDARTVELLLGPSFYPGPDAPFRGTILSDKMGALVFPRQIRIRSLGFLLLGATTGLLLVVGLTG